jgi:hypothetical protein
MMEAPRNEALMMRQLYQSGLIAPIIPSRDALTLARHKRIADSQNYQQIKERRGNESNRANHKMQLDELKENLRTGRMPNIRMANAEQANLERLIAQIDSHIE